MIGGEFFQPRLDTVLGAGNYWHVGGGMVNFRTWYFVNVF